LGVDVDVARKVDQGKEEVPHLLLDRRRVFARDRGVELAELLGHLRARAGLVLPIEADARDLLADALRARERRQAARDAAQDAAPLLLRRLDLLPIAKHLV